MRPAKGCPSEIVLVFPPPGPYVVAEVLPPERPFTEIEEDLEDVEDEPEELDLPDDPPDEEELFPDDPPDPEELSPPAPWPPPPFLGTSIDSGREELL